MSQKQNIELTTYYNAREVSDAGKYFGSSERQLT